MRNNIFKTQPLHPFLLVPFFLSSKWEALCHPFVPEESVQLKYWILNAVGVLSLLGSLVVSLYLILKITKLSSIKSGLLTSLIFYSILFFEDLKNGINIYHIDALRTRYFILMVAVCVVFLIYAIIKSRSSLILINTYFNMLLLALLMYGTSQAIFATHWDSNYTVRKKTPEEDWKLSCNICPDIYYIILDSYTSSESLRKYWRFNNDKFCVDLQNEGFYLANSSRSKFTSTPYSIYSSLNINNDSARIVNLHLFNVVEEVKHNTVTAKLAEAGYKIINLSLFDIPSADRYYNYGNVNPDANSIGNRIVDNTIIKDFFNPVQARRQYLINLEILDSLYSLANKKKNTPHFIYAHIMSPHGPFTMDSLSRFIPFNQQKYLYNPTGYLYQLIGLNKRLIPVIAHIVREKTKPTIVILQGDHGYRFFTGNEARVEASTILNAYYLPSNSNLLYETISPPNTFRFIFNNFFGTKLDLLKD